MAESPLDRSLTLLQAVSANLLVMIGVGPFLTIPFMLAARGGPYVYLREAYKPFGLGPLMGFLFLFQVILVAPLSIASGAVGFADYLLYFWTSLSPATHDVVAAAVALGMTALLYRNIHEVGRLSVVM